MQFEKKTNHASPLHRKAGLSRESCCRQVLSGAEMRRVGSNIHQLLRTANAIGFVDAPRLRETIDELRGVDKLITDAYTAKVR